MILLKIFDFLKLRAPSDVPWIGKLLDSRLIILCTQAVHPFRPVAAGVFASIAGNKLIESDAAALCSVVFQLKLISSTRMNTEGVFFFFFAYNVMRCISECLI